MGLVNQLAIFAPDLAHMSVPIRELLKKGVAFQWLEEQEDAFQTIKNALCSKVLVKPFDPAFIPRNFPWILLRRAKLIST